MASIFRNLRYPSELVYVPATASTVQFANGIIAEGTPGTPGRASLPGRCTPEEAAGLRLVIEDGYILASEETEEEAAIMLAAIARKDEALRRVQARAARTQVVG